MNTRRFATHLMVLLAATRVVAAGASLHVARIEEIDNVPLVRAKIQNSRELWFVIDTGSTRMLVSDRVADELKLKRAENDSVAGAGAGRIPIRKVHDVTLEVAGLTSGGYEFASIDLSGVSSLLGRQIDGIIGYEFLSRFVVTIDYDRRELLLHPPDATSAPGLEIPITLEKRWPFLQARLTVRGVEPLIDTFLIDTGSADAVDHPVLERGGVQKNATQTGRGLGEPVSGFIGTADELQIGSYVLRNLPMAAAGAGASVKKLIGSAVLSRFNITYDYPHSRIWLAERRGVAIEKREPPK